MYAWKFGSTIKYTASATPTANTDYCYSDTALSAGGVKITAYTAAGTNWNNDAVSNHALRVVAMSWRGFENIYGMGWFNSDGCQKNQDDTEADLFCADSTITISGTAYTRTGSSDKGLAFAWKNGSTTIFTKNSNDPAVGATVYSDNALTTVFGTVASKNVVEYDRDTTDDYTSGSFHSYAWKHGSTVIYTKETHPAVGTATYSDQACTTNRNSNVAAFDEDYSQSGMWTTNDSTLYYKVDSDLGIGSASSAMPASGHTGANMVWIPHPFPKASGYVIRFDPWTFLPITLGGDSTLNLACNYYNDAKSGPRLVIRGGLLTHTVSVSPAYVLVNNGLAYAIPYYVSRLAAHKKRQASAA